MSARDRGAVDVSIQMLFGFIVVLASLLLIVEASAYWHTRNVFDEAAAEGARVAAAFDGDCAKGIDAAAAMIRLHDRGWGAQVSVHCTEGPVVVVEIVGPTLGVVSPLLGLRARVVESAPKEG